MFMHARMCVLYVCVLYVGVCCSFSFNIFHAFMYVYGMHLRDECDASYALTRITQARYFDRHSPCKMADFGVYLVPI